jgi:DNA-binding beta-propeller fold protein YncE
MKNMLALVTLSLLGPLTMQAQQNSLLKKITTIPLPGVAGKFDHLAIDLNGNRLFAAATGNHSVEVIDLSTGKVEQSIGSLGKPHGLIWLGTSHSLFVADGSLAELLRYQGTPLKLTGTLKLSEDTDDMAYDEVTGALYVGHGGGNAANPARIAVVDAASFTLKKNLDVASHPEGLDIDPAGNRIFANIADAAEVAVIEGASNQLTAHWKLAKAGDNVPMAYNQEANILYVSARTPANLLVIDAASGVELSRLPTGGGADDMFYDPTLRRVYVICGAGEVDVYQVEANKSMHVLGNVHTESGAKTALFVASQARLYVGIPGANGHPAEIRVYSTASATQ